MAAVRTFIRNNRIYAVKRHLKKKAIVILFIIVVMFTAGTYAWFVSSNSDQSDSLAAGRVEVTMDNTLHITGYVLPGEDIEGNVSITNTSNVNVYLRFKIEVTTLDFFQGVDTFDDVFDLSLGAGWIKKGDWFYHTGLVASGVGYTDIITNLNFRGTVGNEYQGKSFTINATIDAIQGTTSALDGTWILNGDITEPDKTELNY